MDIDIGRLCNAMQRARLTLRYPREQVVAMVRQYTGAHWAEESTTKTVPCNLIALYVDIIGRKLIAGDPRAMLSTDDDDSRPVVNAMEDWVNKEIVKINLAETLERAAVNALFSIGICKVGLASPADAATSGWEVSAGEPFASSIDLDDFVFDIHARTFDQCSFIGHRYRAPLSSVKLNRQEDSEGVPATEDKLFNLEGDERLNVLGRGFYGDYEEFEPMVDLWEVYLPRHQLVVTLLEDNLTGASAYPEGKYHGKAVRIQKWLGPACGPYHVLGFQKVPGNPMPKAPIQDLYDLHCNVNVLLRKMMWQAQNQKTVLPVNAIQTENGTRLLETNDMEAFQCNGEAPVPVSYGGPSQINFQFFGAMKDLFSWLSGNLDVQGGLSPEAKTLGQEKLLSASSSATITSMQRQMTAFTSSVMEALCWYWYHHPTKIMHSRFPLPHMPDMGINRTVHPLGGQGAMRRDKPFDSLNVKVDPFSMPHMTPQEKMALLDDSVAKIIMPMQQILAQAGVAFDANAYLALKAKWGNLPEMKQILTMQEPPALEGPGGGGPGGPEAGPQPAETTRNYVRHSQGNASQFGKDISRGNMMGGEQNGQTEGAGVA